MVEENAIASKQTIAFSVIDGRPVRIEFGTPVRTAGTEGVVSRCGVSTALPNISLLEA